MLQVGVKAPGTAKSTILLPLKRASDRTSLTPSSDFVLNVASGKRSPTLMVMNCSLWMMTCALRAHRVGTCKSRDLIVIPATLIMPETALSALNERVVQRQAVLSFPEMIGTKKQRICRRLLQFRHAERNGPSPATKRSVFGSSEGSSTITFTSSLRLALCAPKVGRRFAPAALGMLPLRAFLSARRSAWRVDGKIELRLDRDADCLADPKKCMALQMGGLGGRLV